MILRGKAEQCSAINANDLCDLSTLRTAFRHRCARLLVVVAKQINDDITTNNVSPKVAWNNALVTIINLVLIIECVTDKTTILLYTICHEN